MKKKTRRNVPAGLAERDDYIYEERRRRELREFSFLGRRASSTFGFRTFSRLTRNGAEQNAQDSLCRSQMGRGVPKHNHVIPSITRTVRLNTERGRYVRNNSHIDVVRQRRVVRLFVGRAYGILCKHVRRLKIVTRGTKSRFRLTVIANIFRCPVRDAVRGTPFGFIREISR